MIIVSAENAGGIKVDSNNIKHKNIRIFFTTNRTLLPLYLCFSTLDMIGVHPEKAISGWIFKGSMTCPSIVLYEGGSALSNSLL
jgi:hypothetical protein